MNTQTRHPAEVRERAVHLAREVEPDIPPIGHGQFRPSPPLSSMTTRGYLFSRWSEVFGDATLAATLLNRLTHHSHILVFEGESYRFRESAERLTKPASKTSNGGQLFS